MTTTSTVPHVTDADFDAAVLSAGEITVAKFTAEWCPPCHVLAPIVESVAAARGDQARVVHVDADASPRASARFGVRGLPTMLFFRGGEVVGRIMGAVPASRIEAELDRVRTG
jgi:thioredoxin 1